MKKKLIIFGKGDYAKVIKSELEKLGTFRIIAEVNKNQDIIKLRNKVGKNTYGIIAIGSNYLREKILKIANKKLPNLKWATIISNNAILAKNIKIGEGSIIISGVIINTGTKIGKHCYINTGSIVEHDNYFEDFSSSGPGVITGGNVKVGKSSYLGIGCVIKNEIKIGSNTVIGGLSFVNKNCNNNSLFFGIPAKKIRIRKK